MFAFDNLVHEIRGHEYCRTMFDGDMRRFIMQYASRGTELDLGVRQDGRIQAVFRRGTSIHKTITIGNTWMDVREDKRRSSRHRRPPDRFQP